MSRAADWLNSHHVLYENTLNVHARRARFRGCGIMFVMSLLDEGFLLRFGTSGNELRELLSALLRNELLRLDRWELNDPSWVRRF